MFLEIDATEAATGSWGDKAFLSIAADVDWHFSEGKHLADKILEGMKGGVS
jgi:hypothetical protein